MNKFYEPSSLAVQKLCQEAIAEATTNDGISRVRIHQLNIQLLELRLLTLPSETIKHRCLATIQNLRQQMALETLNVATTAFPENTRYPSIG